MKKKWISFLVLGLIAFHCSAQTEGYKFYAALDSVKKSGFYNIEVTPELSAYLKTDFSDIRIINGDSKWVPHILHNPLREIAIDAVSYDLKFKKEDIPGVSTNLIIENSFEKISNIVLTITNTEAERFCTLSGSNDKNEWFVINDSILINPVSAEKETQNTFAIAFPPSDYRFFKIVITNKNKDPFNIKSVFWQPAAHVPFPHDKLKKINNPPTSILQKDSGKTSYIKITQAMPYQFDNISLLLSGVKYYKRSVGLYIPYPGKHSFANPGQFLESFTVSNNSTLAFKLPLSKASVFYLLINNEDNLPLTVKEIKTSCSNHYITAYLDSGSNYSLIMDNEDATMPNYDLSELNNKLPDSISYLQFAKITAFPAIVIPAKPEKKSNWMLWSSIGAALLILLFFTARMLKEVDKRKTT